MVAIVMMIIKSSYKIQIKRNEHIPELCLINEFVSAVNV